MDRFDIFLVLLFLVTFGGIFGGMFYDSATSRECRQALAKEQPTRTAAEIAAICR